MTIPGTNLDLWHLFLWQWEAVFYVTNFLCILPFIGFFIVFLIRLAIMWFVWDACAIVYRETAQRGNAAAGLIWAIVCLIWPLTLVIWYRCYGDSPLQLLEVTDAGSRHSPYDPSPVARNSWRAPVLSNQGLTQRMDDDEFDHRPASARARSAAHPQESIRYPQPHPDRDPLANDGDPEVGELRDGDWEPVKPPKAKWARPQINEAKFDPPAEPWKTLGA